MNQIKIDMNSLFTFLHKHFKKDTLLPQQVTINTFLRDYLGQNIKKKIQPENLTPTGTFCILHDRHQPRYHHQVYVSLRLTKPAPTKQPFNQ